ncbi:amino acid adenylation domain-containing protein [Streptosporangium sp. NBC_01755]|nr:amino acid adenylation domain-containing protein [Streptosporangium sp. NBC_01755]
MNELRGSGSGLPLSAAQLEVWFAQQLDPDNPIWNIADYYVIEGELDVALLERAVRVAVGEAECLRARFGIVGDEVRQTVVPCEDWEFSVVDFTGEVDPDGAALGWMRADAGTAVALDAPVLFRFALLRVGPDRAVLYQRAHHLLWDGFSEALFVARVAGIYTAVQEGRSYGDGVFPPLAGLIEEELAYRESARFEKDREFWAGRFAGPVELTSMSSRPITAVRTFVRRGMTLDAGVAERMRAAAWGHRVAWPTYLIAATACYVQRVTGVRDVVLSLPVTARTSAVTKATPGMRANLVPLVLAVRPGMSRGDVLAHASREVGLVVRHQRFRTREIRQMMGLSPEDRRPVGPEVNLMNSLGGMRFGTATVKTFNLTTPPSDDLTIMVHDSEDGGLRVKIDANTDLYDEADVEAHLARFTAFLDTFTTAPADQPLNAIDVLGEQERHRLLVEWNPPAVEGDFTGVVERVREWAATAPDGVAVTDDAGSVTYRELVARANAVAKKLPAGALVGLLGDPGVRYVSAVLGALGAGGAYVPFDPDAPVARTAALVADSGIEVLIAAPEYLDLAREVAGAGGVRMLVFDDAVDDDPAPARGGADDLAYVIYTSGSTGRPKGAMVHRRGMVNHLLAKVEDLGLNPSDVVVQNAPLTFDISVWQMLAALIVGGQVRVVSRETAMNPQRLFGIPGVTVLEVVPSLLRAALDAKVTLPGPELRWLLVTGEALPPELCHRWLQSYPAVPVMNAYGPTECSDDVTHAVIANPDDATGSRTPIGRPIRNTQLYVLGDDLQPVPVGVPGELYVGGTGVGRGYLNDPARTAAVFVASPFGQGRLYRTGDRVVYRPDGRLEFLERRDFQVKIRGHRIELGEIETAIRSADGVRNAVVTAGEQHLVAYVVGQVEPDALQAHVATLLPDYMVPAVVMVLDALPLSPNGKLDRKALPAPDFTALSSGRAPRNPREEALCSVFAEVLDVDSVGVDDSFFDLGGHSLLAVRLISRIRGALGVELSVRDVFDAPTVAGLAERMGEGGRSRPVLVAGPRPSELPLSFGQRRLWFLNLLEGASATYTIPMLLRLRGSLDRGALEQALADVVERHEVLRTVYPEVDGRPVQVIRSDRPELVVRSVTETELPAAIETARSVGFDLTAELPMRAELLVLGPSECVLLVVMHHIASDGWSMMPLARDLAAAYEARCSGMAPRWKPLPVQYVDYALWQRELLGSEDDERSLISEQLAFWTKALDGLPEGITLPADRPRPAIASYRGDTFEFVLTPELKSDLDSLARKNNASLFMVLQAGLSVLLGKLGAGTDVPLGSPVAGRTDDALNDLVGFFVNTLVLRTDLSGDPTVRELLGRVRDADLAAFAHQDVPFERLVEVLNPARSQSRQPLYQVMVVLQNNAAAQVELPGLDAGVEPLNAPAVDFDLEFDFTEHDDGSIGVLVTYATDLFDRATVQEISARLERVLNGMVPGADAPLSAIDVLGQEERRRLLVEWNPPAVEGDFTGVVERVREWAATAPDGVAVTDDAGSVTYRELVARANAVAKKLPAGALVGLLGDPGVRYVSAVLGALGAGGAYVPFDPAAPVARTAALVADSGIEVLIAAPEYLDLAREVAGAGGVRMLVFDDAVDDDPAPARGVADDLAYVIYTSGSTGRPKGAMVHRRGMVNHLLAKVEDLGLNPSDVVVQNAPLTFDISVWQMLAAMIVGGQVRVVSRETAMNPQRLFGVPGVTVLEVVPSLLRAALDAKVTLPGPELRWLLVTGEALPPELCHRWLQSYPAVPVMNAYGPTECSDDVTHAVIANPDDATGSRTPIGRPIRNTQLYVLGDDLQPVPVGVPGELYVGGTGVGRGYLNDPARTAAVFVASPFGQGRLYRTGDRVVYRPDGRLEFLERRDFQVKIRGHRIELGEIETAIRSADGVRNTVVTTGEQHLVAYVVPAAGTLDTAVLREYLTGLLPEYMLPSVYVTLDELPLSSNGKLDRKALPAPDFTALSSGRAPRNPREEALCAVFAEVLDVDSVGVDDNFFDLGGHSLLAVRLISRIRGALGVELSIRDVFDAPTVAGLAERMGEGGRSRSALVAGPRPSELPLSFGQQRLWFLNLLEGASATYNLPIALRLSGELDRDALAQALADVVERHEVLRTVYPEVDGRPVQVIRSDRPELVVRSATETELPAAILAACSVGFDLAAELPMRAELLVLGPSECVLLVVLHHIASDGWSATPLAHDFAAAYEARSSGMAPRWKPLPVQYVDYALWQRELLGSEDDERSLISEQLAFWTRTLDDLPEEITLPADRPRPAIASYRADAFEFVLTRELKAGLDVLARENNASLFMVLQAGLSVLLGKLGAGTDVPLGSPVAGRTDDALDDLVGFFVNTLVLRTDLSGDPTVEELLGRVRDADLAAFAHQDVPFERLVEVLNPARSRSRHPLFQVMMALQNNAAAQVKMTGLDAGVDPLRPSITNFDLTFDFAEHGDGSIGVLVTYATDLFDRATAQRMSERLVRVLDSMAFDADAPLSAIDVLGQEERRRLLVEWNPPAVEGGFAGVVERVRERAVAAPDGVAVSDDSGSVSYRELVGRANAVAKRLPGGALVGLLGDPGVRYVSAVLGALGAGGAYVPFDPGTPVARTAALVADSGIGVLIAAPEYLDLAREAVGAGGVRVLVFDDAVDDDLAPPRGTVDDLAYVMFTSGSTGRPKGAMVHRRGMVNHLLAKVEDLGLGASDVVVQNAPVTFDISVWQMLAALIVGGRVRVVSRETAMDPQRLFGVPGVTVLEVVPSLLRAALDVWDGGVSVPELGLRWLESAGEVLPAELCRRWFQRFPAVPVMNVYAPTECSDGVTGAVIRSSDDVAGLRTPIGGPIRNTRVYVLGDDLQPVPVGVPGELYVGGVGVGRGYLNDPARTAAVFVASPFGGGRLYRTGDRVVYRPDGRLEFLERRDFQVKIRGHRIELGEIETAIRSADGVRNAVVTTGEQHLVAYVVGQVEPGALQAHVATLLPDYMVPAVVMVLDALPLSPNGKLDRKALPAPDFTALSSGRAPRNPREEALCAVFAEVLDVDSVGVDDSFFDLGGHSLIAVRLTSRIRGALGVELSVRDVFDAPTVAGLAERMGEGGRSRPVLVAGPRPGELPLSFGQRRLWFLNLLEGASATYTIPMLLRLRGSLDRDALAAALADVVERHEVLRTVYPEVDGRPVQVIRSDNPELVVRSATEAELPAAIQAACSVGFDLTAELPVRSHLFVLGPTESVLLLVLHHIAGDGWSMMPLARDFAAAYEARCSGMVPGWKSLPVQYVDYALWQRELLGGEDDERSLISEQLAFWTKALDGLPEEITLPADRPRPAIASYQADAFEFVLTPELTSGLDVLARQSNASLFMVLQAGLSVLLGKLGAGTDIPLGSPFAGRTDDALDGLVGFFVNTLVLRADLSGDPTVRELLGRVRDADLAAFAHQDVPFERLVEVLNPARSRSRHPLFQVMVVLQNNAAARIELAGLDAGVDPLRPSVSDFDLTFGFTEHGDGGVGVLVTYATDLFDRATVQRMSERLVRVLDSMAFDADASLSAIDVLGQEERRRLLVEWNSSAVEGGFAGVVERVRERAVAAPDGVAVSDDSGSVSYRELVARANAVAKRLPAGALVGLLGGPGVRFVSAVLGVLGAGGAYVPFDPDAPVARTAALVADSGIGVLIAAPEYLDLAREAVGAGGVRVLVFDDAVDDDLAPARGAEDDLAYVMFTSGSTGRPKGAMVHRRGMVNHLLAKVEDLGLDSSDVVMLNAPLTFDMSVWQMLAALIVGGRVRVVSRESAMDPQRLFGVPGVTVLEVVPSLLRAALDVGVTVSGPGLRWLLVAGEALPAELCHRWLQRYPAVPMINAYGPTECSIGVTQAAIRHADDATGSRTPIGRPIRNTQLYVLGDDLQPVPVGVPGELYVGGVGVGRGYLNDSARTAAVFVASPFGQGRLYRTGDRVVYRPDGRLEFLERRDFQVKIRGHRIELGEIETAIRSADGVRNTVVTTGEQHLVAYVVPAAGTLDTAVLREYLTGLLPEYMLPSVYVTLDALPLTSNGKLDRKALPEPDFTALSSGRAPRNSREEVLCSAFAEVLDVETVSIDDSFFDLGGHSLLAVRLISRIRGALGVELSVRDVFDAPTVAGLAERMGEGGRSRSALVAGPRPSELPLSFGQRRLWFLNLLEGASATYNIPMLLRLRGSLDQDALAQALADVVERHEVLRTVYPEVDGRPVQVIRSDRPELVVRSATEAELPAAIGTACSTGFDLTAESPMRAELYVLGQSEYVLLVVLHHIASDGWSMMPLARDFATAYEARCSGMAPRWASLPVQYVDYALWQRELLGSEDDERSLISEQLAFWTKTLEGLPEEIALPTDRPRPAIASYRGDAFEFVLTPELKSDLNSLARKNNASLFMVLRAGLSVLLGKLGAGTDIPLGSPVAGRTDDALDDLVGFFVNTLVLRTDLSGDPTVRELLGRVRDADLAAFAHQDVPFERLVEVLNPARSQSRQPLFQVMVVLQNNAAARVELPGLDAGVEPLNAPAVDFDLEFDFTEHDDGGIGVLVTYATDLFDRATVQEISARLERVLNGMASGVDAPLSAIDVLGERERRRLLVEWNSSAVEGDFTGVVERVREWAATAPDGVAVCDDSGSVTYRELVARANAVTKKLPAGALVGLLGDPGIRYVSAVLGVLGAGGAYVPFDPGTPVARTAALVADSGIGVLIAAPEYLDLAREAVGAGGVRVLVFDDAVDDDLAPVRGVGDDLAYVIYTSGSTGRPKGAMVHRRGMVNHLLAQVEDLELDSSDVMVQNAPLTFDMSVGQMLAGLIVGAQVRVVSRETAMNPQQLFGVPGVTVLEMVPSLLRAALDVWDAGVPVPELGLRWLLVGGEALPAELCHRWLQRYPAVPVMNEYGPTECSVCVTSAVIRNPDDATGLRTPIGRPVRNTQLYVLGDDLQPVPVGVPGELYVGGTGVGRGYLNDSARTAAVFVASPFGQGRLYRTGDRVVYRPDGRLEFLERRDFQVKIRGHRIELGEIETAIRSADGVRNTVVTTGEQHLVAYVVPAAGPLDTAVLREYLTGLLPEYMLPSVYVTLDELPLSSNGKLDRKALPTPDFTALSSGRAPRNPREEALCSVFAEVLDVDSVGVDDNFFDLGGHSLLAVRLISRIRGALGVELSIRDVFDAPTVAGLAGRADVSGSVNSFEVLLPLRVTGHHTPIFCVHPVGCVAWPYIALTAQLGPDFPVYGLQARGMLEPDRVPESVEQMAADYLEQVRTVQPEGPYHLLGWSFGGVVAHEMARQLQQAGQTVALLASLDSHPVAEAGEVELTSDTELLRAILALFGHAAPQRPSAAEVLEILRHEHNLAVLATEEQLMNVVAAWRANVELNLAHRPGRVGGRMLHFVAGRENTPGDWTPFAETVDNHRIDCGHDEMLQPEPLAEISRVLAKEIIPKE